MLTGDSHLIINIVESRGDQIDQETSPNELPISGTPGEDMKLSILNDASSSSSSRDMFALDGKRIRLLKPLDRDENDISSIMFQVHQQIMSVVGPYLKFSFR